MFYKIIKMKKILLGFILIGTLMTTSCTSSNDFKKGKEQLEQQGYTNIVNTGHAWFCCDDKERYSTGFSCKDKNGNTVEGCFCSNFFKGITIRFN